MCTIAKLAASLRLGINDLFGASPLKHQVTGILGKWRNRQLYPGRARPLGCTAFIRRGCRVVGWLFWSELPAGECRAGRAAAPRAPLPPRRPLPPRCGGTGDGAATGTM